MAFYTHNLIPQMQEKTKAGFGLELIGTPQIQKSSCSIYMFSPEINILRGSRSDNLWRVASVLF